MVSTDSVQPARTEPADAIAERLNDPAVAASLVTLLDNADLISTLVLGLSGLIARSETIMDSVVDGLEDFRASNGFRPAGAPSLADLSTVTSELVEAAPALRSVLNSAMTRPETIALLAMMSEAATEGVERARANDTRVKGALGAMRTLKEPEVQRGLGMMIEVARALGRRLDAAP